MTTPRIEEMVEEFEKIFVYQYELSEGFERPVGSEPSFRKEVKAEHMGDVLKLIKESKDWLRTALTQAQDTARRELKEELLKMFDEFSDEIEFEEMAQMVRRFIQTLNNKTDV